MRALGTTQRLVLPRHRMIARARPAVFPIPYVEAFADTQALSGAGNDWVDMANIEALDGQYAWANIAFLTESKILHLYGFDTSALPDTATVIGIRIGVYGKKNFAADSCSQLYLQGSDGLVIADSNRTAEFELAWPNDGWTYLGEVATLANWGATVQTYTTAQFKNANFGFRFRYQGGGDVALNDVQVDYWWMRLYYRE